VLTALRCEDELAIHVRAALRNGLDPQEIGEVLLQTAIYAGVPAANRAYAIAQRTLADAGITLDAPDQAGGASSGSPGDAGNR
jgi:4-carboxymuconolactone decarboxylase